MLMGYGFCIEDNEFDMVSLKLAISSSLPSEKQELLASNSSGLYYLTQTQPLPDSLVEQFRVQVATKDEVKRLKEGRPVGLRCELDALATLNLALSIKVSQIKVPQLQNPTRRQINICYYVANQAKILKAFVLTLTQRMMKLLQISTESLDTQDIATLRGKVHESMKDFGFSLKSIYQDKRYLEFFETLIAAFEGYDTSGMQEQFLALFLCYQDLYYNDSPYYEWLQVMRTRYDNEEELDDSYIEDHEEWREMIMPVLTHLNPEIFRAEKWTARVIAWARKVVDSESVYVPYDEYNSTEFFVVTKL